MPARQARATRLPEHAMLDRLTNALDFQAQALTCVPNASA
jgi:hypothetical protein